MMKLGILVAFLTIGCATPELDVLFTRDGTDGQLPPAIDPVCPSGSSGSSSGGGSGSSSSSSSGCFPSSAACKGECGEADDGCGGRISCGVCSAGQTCMDDGKCCQPVTIAKCASTFPVGTCGRQPDGCGGMVACDTVCGLNDGMLTCGDDGKCHCIDATTQVGYMQAQAICKNVGRPYPAYCWIERTKNSDIPAGCGWYSVDTPGLPYDLFCCQAPP